MIWANLTLSALGAGCMLIDSASSSVSNQPGYLYNRNNYYHWAVIYTPSIKQYTPLPTVACSLACPISWHHIRSSTSGPTVYS
ncbi:hypothetical protein HDV64DRAFT_246812 [Trichoderma sp. TUCIM 5745]